jgi:uncharacterized protein (DUF885 family)
MTGGNVTQPLRPDGLPEPTSPFESAVVDLLVDLFAAYPTWGTGAGYHAVDHAWPDLSESGRMARLDMLRGHRERLERLDRGVLSADERIDRGILIEEIEKAAFGDEVLREEAWDPLSIVYLVGSGLFGVLSREYAPWGVRAAALASRIEGIPNLLDQALSGLTGLGDRPVSLLHLDTALAQLDGITELVNAALTEARSRADAGEGVDLVATLEAAGASAAKAVETFRSGLDGAVRGRATGEGRLGTELFARKLQMTLGSDLSPGALRSKAWADYNAVRSEMLRLARESWSHFVPDESLPAVTEGDTAGERALVARVLDAIAADHQTPDALITYCEAEVGRIEVFCRDNDVITLPDEPMSITWTPLFMRAYGRAFLDSPGPLDRGLASHFWVTPPDASSGQEAVESYLREDNDRMLRILTIHEGIPGHYLQLAEANRCPSLARTVFTNGMFAEGWATYVTQVMMDLGYGADDPGLLLTHWKMYLRATTNAVLDVETHAGSMDEAGAMELMVDGGWQEEDEASAKWLRARLTSTQLSTYYVGSVEMWDLDVEARRRAAVLAGAGVDAVPEQRVVGDLGRTPGFDQKLHLEAVISNGTPAIKWARRIMLEGAT